jgi:hypothetical protein
VVERNGDVLGESTRLAEAWQALVGTGVGMARLTRRTRSASQDEGRDQTFADAMRGSGTSLDHLAAVFVATDLARLDARVFARPAMPVRPADAAAKYLEHHTIFGTNRIGNVLD